MSERFIVWGCLALVAFVGVVGGLYTYPALSPEDSEGLARSLVLRVSTMLVGFIFLVLALIATDTVTPGDWLADIEKHPIAEAILVSALVFGLSLIFIYS